MHFGHSLIGQNKVPALFVFCWRPQDNGGWQKHLPEQVVTSSHEEAEDDTDQTCSFSNSPLGILEGVHLTYLMAMTRFKPQLCPGRNRYRVCLKSREKQLREKSSHVWEKGVDNLHLRQQGAQEIHTYLFPRSLKAKNNCVNRHSRTAEMSPRFQEFICKIWSNTSLEVALCFPIGLYCRWQGNACLLSKMPLLSPAWVL